MSLSFVSSTPSPSLKRQREQAGAAIEGPMARLLIPGDGGEGEGVPVELSTAGVFSMQTQQVLDRLNEGQLAREAQTQGLLCGTMAPCSSGRAYITLESTVFTWEPVLSPLTAPLEAPGMDQSIPIQDVNGAPYLDGSRGRAVAVLSLGASGRIVVVLDQGHVLLRNTASAYGAHDYTVTLEADKDEKVSAASVAVVNDNPRQGYWVLVGTSLGRVHRLGPLMAETADRAPEIMQLGPAKDKGGWLPLSFFGGREELGPQNLVSLVVDGDWVVAIGQREAAAYRLHEHSPRRPIPSLGQDSVTLGGGLLAPGVLLRLSYAYASESLSLHVVDYLRMTDIMGHDTLLWTQPGLHIPSLSQARLHLSPANTPFDVLGFITLPGHDKVDVFVIRARVPVEDLPAPLHVSVPRAVLGGQLLGCGFLEYNDALLLFTTRDGGSILRLDAPRLTAPLPAPMGFDAAKTEGLKREIEGVLQRLGQLEREGHGAAAADVVHHDLQMGLLSQRVVGENDACLGEALRRVVAQTVERTQGAGAYFGVGAGGDVSKLVSSFLCSKHKDGMAVLQALERVGLLGRLSDAQKTMVTKGMQQCAAMVRLCSLLQDATSPERGAAPEAFRHTVIEAVKECKAQDARSSQLPMDYFLIWPSKITERLALIQSFQSRVQATSDRVEVVNCVSQLLCDVLEAATLESTRLRNAHRFRPVLAHGWPAEPSTLALLQAQLSMLRSVKDSQHSAHLEGMRVPELTVRLARSWLGALGRQATPAQRREAVMAVYEYEKAGSAREALRLAREHDALDVLAEIQYAEGKHGEGARHYDQLIQDLSHYPGMARHLFRYLYEQRQYHDLLQLGASSASAQRELEALLQADKNARRLAWVNEINARKYTACARTLLELERDTLDSPNLRSLFWSLGQLSVEAATATPLSDEQMHTPQDMDGFEDVKSDIYEDGLLILAQRLLEWALHVNNGLGFQRVLSAGEILETVLHLTVDQLACAPPLPDGRPDSARQKNVMLSLFRTAMDVIDCLQGRRGMVWGQDEHKGREACVTLWYKIVTFRDDWEEVWAADNAFGGQRGKQTIFYKVIKCYSQDRRQPQAYDYPRISEPTDNVLAGVIEMIRRTRMKGGTVPPTLEHTLLQHRNEAQTDQLDTDRV